VHKYNAEIPMYYTCPRIIRNKETDFYLDYHPRASGGVYRYYDHRVCSACLPGVYLVCRAEMRELTGLN